MLVDAHPTPLEVPDNLHDVIVHAKQIGNVKQASSDGLLILAKPDIEKRPGREVAASEWAHWGTAGHVLVFGSHDNVVVGSELVKLGNTFRKGRSDVLGGNVGSVKRIVSLPQELLHVSHAFSTDGHFLHCCWLVLELSLSVSKIPGEPLADQSMRASFPFGWVNGGRSRYPGYPLEN